MDSAQLQDADVDDLYDDVDDLDDDDLGDAESGVGGAVDARDGGSFVLDLAAAIARLIVGDAARA